MDARLPVRIVVALFQNRDDVRMKSARIARIEKILKNFATERIAD